MNSTEINLLSYLNFWSLQPNKLPSLVYYTCLKPDKKFQKLLCFTWKKLQQNFFLVRIQPALIKIVREATCVDGVNNGIWEDQYNDPCFELKPGVLFSKGVEAS